MTTSFFEGGGFIMMLCGCVGVCEEEKFCVGDGFCGGKWERLEGYRL